MSVRAQDCIQTASDLISDTGQTSITADKWLAIFNQAQRKLSTRIDMVEAEAYFDLQANVMRYAYPPDCVAITAMWWTPTPDDPTTFQRVFEIMKPEFESMTNGTYPSGDAQYYFCKPGLFYMTPMLDRTIVGGGLLSYIYTPADLTDPTQTVEWPDMMRELVSDYMQILGLRRLKQYDEAAANEKTFEAIFPEVKDRLEDRSRDRLPALRPKLFASASRRSQV